MLRRVPTGISLFFGTIAVSTVSSSLRTNLTWLPFWLASTKPAASSRRLTSRKGWGLSRPNLDLDGANPGFVLLGFSRGQQLLALMFAEPGEQFALSARGGRHAVSGETMKREHS